MGEKWVSSEGGGECRGWERMLAPRGQGTLQTRQWFQGCTLGRLSQNDNIQRCVTQTPARPAWRCIHVYSDSVCVCVRGVRAAKCAGRVLLVRARSGDLIGAAAAGMSPAFQWAVALRLFTALQLSLSLSPFLALLLNSSPTLTYSLPFCSFSNFSSIFSRPVFGFFQRIQSYTQTALFLSVYLLTLFSLPLIRASSFNFFSAFSSLKKANKSWRKGEQEVGCLFSVH